MTNYNNADTPKCAMGSGLPQEAIDKAVKALISLASSATEADKVVREFNPELDGEDTESLLEDKYNYVSKLYGVNQKARASCDPLNAEKFQIAAINYYSLLSVLILR